MQDIGGCRAIVKDLSELNKLRDKLVKSKSTHCIVNEYDYLNPKESGYGGVHLIYSCFDTRADGYPWKKTKIEVQLRTKLQHAWATSLEIIDTLEQIELKTSLDGHADWRRFFSVTGKLVAHEEGAITLDDATLKEHQLEVMELDSTLDARMKLLQFSIGIKALTSKDKKILKNKNTGMILVTISQNNINTFIDNIKDIKGKVTPLDVNVKSYKMKDTEKALKDLNKHELDPDIIIAVLLSASNARTLKKAYPNYFGSTQEFSDFIKNNIGHVEE
jgi:hypothetical protein